MRIEIQIRENLAALRRQGLHAAKAPLEFRVRGPQRRLSVDIELAREIRGREQQVADFLEDLPRRARGKRAAVIGKRALYSGATFGRVG